MTKAKVEEMNDVTLVVYATEVCKNVVGSTDGLADDKEGLRTTGRLIGAGPEMLNIIAEMAQRMIGNMSEEERRGLRAMTKTLEKQAETKSNDEV